MNVITNPAAADTVGVRKVDVSRGTRRGEVSSQWFSRPADQRYLSLNELFAATARRRDSSTEAVIDAGRLRFVGSQEDPTELGTFILDGQTTTKLFPNDSTPVTPSHHAFGQLCQLAKMGGATNIFRSQPSWLAGLNLTYGLSRNVRDEPVKLYADSEQSMLRAATGPDYGRIFDADLVSVVQRFAGDGTGDTHWKIPGVMDWSAMAYNPYVDVTSESTTLFASDRDVFLFLCDDTHPIEIGKLRNGDPDLVFRGFMAWNSEVGSRSLGIATFWLRAVCQNRNLWGVEDFSELRIVHSKYGNDRFVREAAPALERYAASEPTKLLAGINAAKDAVVARDDDDRVKFLTADSLGFSLKRAQEIVAICEREEHHKPETVWDMVNGITAYARTIPQTDARLDVEKLGAKLMDRAARHVI